MVQPTSFTSRVLIQPNIPNDLQSIRFQNYHWILGITFLVGAWPTPLKNDGVRQLGWWNSHILWKNKKNPNHQPFLGGDNMMDIWMQLWKNKTPQFVQWHLQLRGWALQRRLDLSTGQGEITRWEFICKTGTRLTSKSHQRTNQPANQPANQAAPEASRLNHYYKI